MTPQDPPPNLPTPAKGQQQTKLGRLTETLLQNIWEPLDLVGKGLMGDLWRTVYLSVQDAIALGVLVKVPNLVGQFFIGKSFTSFDICLKENPLGSVFYACFIIVAADFFALDRFSEAHCQTLLNRVVGDKRSAKARGR
ncbi:hypothetical protein [Pseudanabaena sp. PCC 6802]|uniref:hypothetical protein n=1 Tax=Pseudanabaena sp. PCC 6802 TaxID=118173 RepID=UPI000372B1F4|nr:hypothetical protein [Pseudanabaena sp. PCC 6802]